MTHHVERFRPALWCGVAAMLSSSGPLLGQGSHADASIAVRAATTGFGAEVAKLIAGHFDVRVGGTLYTWSTTKSQSDITYDASLKLHTFEALCDLSPGRRGSFHFTAGLATNPLTITASGLPTTSGTFKINGTQYTTSQVGTLTAQGKFRSVRPYLGLGFGTPANDHRAAKLLFDIGAILGKPSITLTASGAASNPQLAADLQAQAAQTEHDVRKFLKAYPVMALGLAYRM
jgi:hypothetical protein